MRKSGFPMGRRGRYLAVIALGSAAALFCSVSVRGQGKLPLEQVKLPPGFEISLYARAPGARSLALSPGGTLFVGTRDEGGNVYAIRSAPGREPTVVTLARGLR